VSSVVSVEDMFRTAPYGTAEDMSFYRNLSAWQLPVDVSTDNIFGPGVRPSKVCATPSFWPRFVEETSNGCLIEPPSPPIPPSLPPPSPPSP